VAEEIRAIVGLKKKAPYRRFNDISPVQRYVASATIFRQSVFFDVCGNVSA